MRRQCRASQSGRMRYRVPPVWAAQDESIDVLMAGGCHRFLEITLVVVIISHIVLRAVRLLRCEFVSKSVDAESDDQSCWYVLYVDAI